MVLAARLRLRHPGCYSETLPSDIKVIHWGRDKGDCMVVVSGPSDAAFEEVVRALGPHVHAPPQVVSRSETSMVLRCLCLDRTQHVQDVQNAGAVYLWPIIYEGGYEWFSLMAPTRDVLSKAVEALGRAGAVRVEELTGLDPDDLVADPRLPRLREPLTERQLELLQFAIERGYYRYPRRVTIAELAASLDIAPSTMQEHLQKATERLMGSLFDAGTFGPRPADA